jgi:hypothetical protein
MLKVWSGSNSRRNNMNYVVGFQDTRQEFYPKGVTRNKAKAEAFKKMLQKQQYPNDRQWVAIHEVPTI